MLSMTLQAADTVSSIFAPVSTPAAKEADLAKMVPVLRRSCSWSSPGWWSTAWWALA